MPDGEIEVTPDGSDIDREWVDMRLNDFDDHALEQAVLLKEAVGGRVIAAAPNVDGINRLLQTAVARGADQAMCIQTAGDKQISSRELADAVVSLTRQVNAQLVLTGVQAPDDLFGQLAPYAGALLDWPHVSGVSSAKVAGDAVEVLQEQGNGHAARFLIKMPAVLGIQAASQAPRYVSGTKLRQATGIAITSIPAPLPSQVLNIPAVSLAAPQASGTSIMLDGSATDVAAEIFDVLRNKGMLLGQGL